MERIKQVMEAYGYNEDKVVEIVEMYREGRERAARQREFKKEALEFTRAAIKRGEYAAKASGLVARQ
jgi:hypothetical protein